MLKILARWFAKRAYLWKLETEGANHALHAKLAATHAQQKRDQVEQLNKDADAIEANIKEVAKRLEAASTGTPTNCSLRCGEFQLLAPLGWAVAAVVSALPSSIATGSTQRPSIE